MSNNELTELGNQATGFARTYVRLVEALVAEGVEEHVAQEEARLTSAMAAAWDADDLTGEVCPLCGRSR